MILAHYILVRAVCIQNSYIYKLIMHHVVSLKIFNYFVHEISVQLSIQPALRSLMLNVNELEENRKECVMPC